MGFTHLNLASAYSAHYGVNRPEQLAGAAKALGFEALAVTDRDGLYGAVKHIASCIKEGLHPIVGVNLEVTEMGRVVILAHGHNSGSGWGLICRAISRAHNSRGKEPRPRLDLEELAAMVRENPSCSILLGPESTVAKKLLPSPS
ncbi:MAG: PHP domain-containing protein, partial [Aquiluna sp.]